MFQILTMLQMERVLCSQYQFPTKTLLSSKNEYPRQSVHWHSGHQQVKTQVHTGQTEGHSADLITPVSAYIIYRKRTSTYISVYMHYRHICIHIHVHAYHSVWPIMPVFILRKKLELGINHTYTQIKVKNLLVVFPACPQGKSLFKDTARSFLNNIFYFCIIYTKVTILEYFCTNSSNSSLALLISKLLILIKIWKIYNQP